MKMWIAFLAGAAVAVAVVVGVNVFMPSARAEENTSEQTVTDDNETTTQDIINMLEQGRSRITDTDTLAYYDKLVAGYQLNDSQGNPVAVPDIEQIQNTAVTLPLREAGKQIRDPEIKEFYYKFLTDSGFNIE
jgi:hypothetical protein